MEAVKIIASYIAAAVSYGIVHDQITARICVEYFTVAHPPIFATDDPTLLGLGWGVVATWWAGLGVGLVVAAASRIGPYPKRTARSLLPEIGRLLVVMAVGALLAGTLGGWLAQRGSVRLGRHWQYLISPERHVPFLICAWTHSASYYFGFIGGLLTAAGIRRSRRRMAKAAAKVGETNSS
ncbi:MAG: hypothetical protein QM775_26100 [Pirellulales bacterium]